MESWKIGLIILCLTKLIVVYIQKNLKILMFIMKFLTDIHCTVGDLFQPFYMK